MNAANTTGRSVWVGVVAAVASSLCCITPLLAALAGVGSLAGAFHWVGPARPYLIGLAFLALGYAWWLRLRPAPAVDDCCAVPVKRSFFQRTGFLVAITVFAVVTSAFPLYAGIFSSSTEQLPVSAQQPLKQVTINVTGMTCTGCETHVNNELARVKGVVEHSASYAQGVAIVSYDPAMAKEEDLLDAIKRAGYEGSLTKTTEP